MKINLEKAVNETVQEITHKVKSRAFRAANELRSSAIFVLKGDRSGRTYRVPFTNAAKYRASAPGEAPAQRSGNLRMSWRPQAESENTGIGKGFTVNPAITSDVKYAPWLQEGTPKMAARPFREPIINHAAPRIEQIFKEPY